MDQLIIEGNNKLEGNIRVNGAKNSILPILAGSLLTEEEVILKNAPLLNDVQIMNKIVRNVKSKIFKNNSLKPNYLNEIEIPETQGNKISSSLLLIGALMTYFSKVKIPLPGGCSIGKRKIDFHIEGLTALGANIRIKNGHIIAETKKGLIGADINFNFPSVGATHQIIIAACLADGTTVIKNAAKEPEVIDLANFLNSMGADIKGAGTGFIKIKGVDKLGGTMYSVMPDRINTGTYMVAAAITGGNILLQNTDLHHSKSFIDKLREIGVKINETNKGIEVIAPDKIQPVDIITEVYPGFATDMQPIITPLLALANGKSIIHENIFDNRFNHIPGLIKMGADIKINERTAVVNGVHKLRGSQVAALDLRAGAALILAGLAAKGKTEIKNVYQIDRGYENIVDVLRGVGANIERRIFEVNA